MTVPCTVPLHTLQPQSLLSQNNGEFGNRCETTCLEEKGVPATATTLEGLSAEKPSHLHSLYCRISPSENGSRRPIRGVLFGGCLRELNVLQ